MSTIILRNGHVKPVWAGHPWVFAQAIKTIEGAPTDGDIVRVTNETGRFLGQGFYSPHSAIPVRILSHDPSETLDAGFLHHRIEKAYRLRTGILGLPNEHTNGYRLIHSEGDHLGGLTVDMYGDVAAVQFSTIGMKQREDDIVASVQRITHAKTVVEIARSNTQRLEGFEATTQVVRGPSIDALSFKEAGIHYSIPLDVGQKTGFYFDQRETRTLVQTLAHDKRVLDAFCYLGSFSLAALKGGARHTTAIDSSASVLATAASIVETNGYGGQVEFVRADVRTSFPALRDRNQKYDFIIVDPPKLIPSIKHLAQGRRAYQKINTAALRLLDTEGLLLSCSCSAALGMNDLLRVMALSAKEASRNVQVLKLGIQGPDHPTLPAFPEGRYLKYVLMKVE